MHLSLRKLLFVVFLGLATIVASTGYAQVSDDPCDCCPPEVHMMDCTLCKVCPSPALVSQPAPLAIQTREEVHGVTREMSPSKHIEDIWHPPKCMAS